MSTIRFQNNDIILEGYLTKKGYWNRNFKLRYFVLHQNGDLRYFSSEADKIFQERALKVISLSTEGTEATVRRGGLSNYAEIKLSIVCPNYARTFTFGAPTISSQVQWMLALESCICNQLSISSDTLGETSRLLTLKEFLFRAFRYSAWPSKYLS
jgi:hypothetical protein